MLIRNEYHHSKRSQWTHEDQQKTFGIQIENHDIRGKRGNLAATRRCLVSQLSLGMSFSTHASHAHKLSVNIARFSTTTFIETPGASRHHGHELTATSQLELKIGHKKNLEKRQMLWNKLQSLRATKISVQLQKLHQQWPTLLFASNTCQSHKRHYPRWICTRQSRHILCSVITAASPKTDIRPSSSTSPYLPALLVLLDWGQE